MSKPKAVYSPQYRQQLVELVLAGRSANDVAKEFGLHATTVAKWVRLDRMGAASSAKPSSVKPSTGPLNANERQELMELRRKLRQVQMERDILAKATAWFVSARQTHLDEVLRSRPSSAAASDAATTHVPSWPVELVAASAHL